CAATALLLRCACARARARGRGSARARRGREAQLGLGALGACERGASGVRAELARAALGAFAWLAGCLVRGVASGRIVVPGCRVGACVVQGVWLSHAGWRSDL